MDLWKTSETWKNPAPQQVQPGRQSPPWQDRFNELQTRKREKKGKECAVNLRHRKTQKTPTVQV